MEIYRHKIFIFDKMFLSFFNNNNNMTFSSFMLRRNTILDDFRN